MHKIFILVILIFARLAPFAQQNNNTADSVAVLQAQALKQTEQKKGYANDHPGAQWFPKAGLGLFIHWGMAAVSGVGDLSWSMLANKPWKDNTMTPNAYYALAEKWDPSKIDFDKILSGANQ